METRGGVNWMKDKITDMKYLMKLITDEPHWYLNDTLRIIHDHLERYCEEIDEESKGQEVIADLKKQINYQHRFVFDDRDSEEDCIERIQRLIDMIYMSNPKLNYDFRPHIYLKLNVDETESERNEELIDRCVDIECNFSRKTNTDHLSVLIKDYREVNKLDIQDTVENLIKAVNVEAGELLETTNFGKVINPKKVEEELADVLIYCFSLASELNTPVDRIIARKIKKNIEIGRQYD